MNLLLWRHADAEDGSPDLTRSLTAKGRDQAAAVARWLKRELPEHPRLLVSPALRARETAEALGLEFEIEPQLAPGASADEVLRLVGQESTARGTPGSDLTLLLVGHQPWIGEAAAMLISGSEAPWSVRKAALWWLVQRRRAGQAQWTVRVVIDPDYV